MPKKDYFHKPGTPLDQNIKEIILKHFSEEEVIKIIKHGGRLQISLTTPFVNQSKQNKDKTIDSVYLDSLKADIEKAKFKLEILNKNQLKEVAGFIKLPIASKANKNEILTQIITRLNAPEFWQGISS